MKLCSDILLKNLSQYVTVECFGKRRNTLSLNPPVFFYGDMAYKDNMVYVGRSGELPPPPDNVSCQIVCVGGSFPSSWKPKNCCAFSVISETDLLTVFNILQETYIRYSQWSVQLFSILDTTANIEEMIQLTSELLGKPITLINNQLEIVVQTGLDNMSKEWSQLIPASVHLWAGSHNRNTSMRKPFIYEINGSFSYCINIYIHDVYWGMISIGIDQQEPVSSDTIIFDYFFDILLKAVEKNAVSRNSNMITLKSVLTDLLNCLPVSDVTLQKAYRNSGQENGLWLCAAIHPLGAMNNLPPEYFCRQLEIRFPKCSAITFDSHIALYLPLQHSEINADGKHQLLEAALSDMELQAGVSFIFEDIIKAHFYYRQAVITFETGSRLDPGRSIFYFHDYALAYALKNSVGELKPEYIMPEGLMQLLNDNSSGIDYWRTLKVYLDNEMNVSQTARDLFIHRTTLQTRLHKIKDTVDLSTADRRIYIRYCIYLQDLFEKL